MSGPRRVRARWRTALAGLVAVGAAASGSRAEVPAPAWRLEPDAFVHYARAVLEREDSLRPNPELEDGVDAVIGFHGHELDPERRGLRLGPTHVDRLFKPFVFALPSSSAPGAPAPTGGSPCAATHGCRRTPAWRTPASRNPPDQGGADAQVGVRRPGTRNPALAAAEQGGRGSLPGPRSRP